MNINNTLPCQHTLLDYDSDEWRDEYGLNDDEVAAAQQVLYTTPSPKADASISKCKTDNKLWFKAAKKLCLQCKLQKTEIKAKIDTVKANARKAQAEACLLYTSPSPRDS